jgi:hypothetical protein
MPIHELVTQAANLNKMLCFCRLSRICFSLTEYTASRRNKHHSPTLQCSLMSSHSTALQMSSRDWRVVPAFQVRQMIAEYRYYIG